MCVYPSDNKEVCTNRQTMSAGGGWTHCLASANEDPSNAVVKRTCHGSAWTSEDVAGMPMHRLAFAECKDVKNSNYPFTGEFASVCVCVSVSVSVCVSVFVSVCLCVCVHQFSLFYISTSFTLGCTCVARNLCSPHAGGIGGHIEESGCVQSQPR